MSNWHDRPEIPPRYRHSTWKPDRPTTATHLASAVDRTGKLNSSTRRPLMNRTWPCILALPLITISACNWGGAANDTGGDAVIPEPSFAYDATGGCSDLILYQTNTGQTEALVVTADTDMLGLKVGVTAFDLAAAPKDLDVAVRVFYRSQKHLNLCTDFLDPNSDTPGVWTAIAGKLTIERSSADPKSEGKSRTYRARATIENAEFRGPTGYSVKCPHTVTLDATVGWYPG